MTRPLVSIQLIVFNGERYIRHCLEALASQGYPHESLELVVFDNGSTDQTKAIIAELKARFASFHSFRVIESTVNLGMWPAQEKTLSYTTGPYVLAVSVDVMIDGHFIEEGVRALESDLNVGAIQGKIYQYSQSDLPEQTYQKSTTIDTCGFALTRERKVVNIGHGKPDSSLYSQPRQIFGVEGAVPLFRRSALENCRMNGEIWDADYFWYGDDLDLAWRMTLFGHTQLYLPSAVAWHDRSTTKGATTTGLLSDYVERRKVRRTIPISKRRLDWSNTRFTIIKNDYVKNIARDILPIVLREINVQGYATLFEPGVLVEWGRFLALIPRMLHRRSLVMRRAVISPEALRRLMLIDTRELKTPPPLEKWLLLLQITGIGLLLIVIFLAVWVVIGFFR